ncbi:hypothetical protein HDU79_009733 [Rhizoclosmatium sp. JEL0117]|nr:hypothetical protein HDU79_009733 [Rhizoclosmatium sp. JEL0117]
MTDPPAVPATRQRNAFDDDDWESSAPALLPQPPANSSAQPTSELSANATPFTFETSTATTFNFAPPPKFKIMKREQQQQQHQQQNSPQIGKRLDSNVSATSKASADSSSTPPTQHISHQLEHSSASSRTSSPAVKDKDADAEGLEKKAQAKDEQYREARRRIMGIEKDEDEDDDAGGKDAGVNEITKGVANTRLLSDVAILDNPVLERMQDPEYSRRPVTPPDYRRGPGYNGYEYGGGMQPGRMPSGPPLIPGAGAAVWGPGIGGAPVVPPMIQPPLNPAMQNNPNLYTFAQLQIQYQQQQLLAQQQQQQGAGVYANQPQQSYQRPTYPNATPRYHSQQQQVSPTHGGYPQQAPSFQGSKRYSSQRSGSSISTTSSVGSDYQQYQQQPGYPYQQQQQQLYNPSQQYNPSSYQYQQQQPYYGQYQQQHQNSQSPTSVDLSANAFPPLGGGNTAASGGSGKSTPTKMPSKQPKQNGGKLSNAEFRGTTSQK